MAGVSPRRTGARRGTTILLTALVVRSAAAAATFYLDAAIRPPLRLRPRQRVDRLRQLRLGGLRLRSVDRALRSPVRPRVPEMRRAADRHRLSVARGDPCGGG